MRLTISALALALCMFASPVHAQQRAAQRSEQRYQAPNLLTFDELVRLSSTAKPSGDLAIHLDNVLSEPFVSNEASAEGLEPRRPIVASLGPVLRVASWNIERGLNFDLIRAALTDPEEFRRLAANHKPIDADRESSIESQLAKLQGVDVLVLNEVDFGMKRTGYRDVARDLAAALHMNYAYGVEFVEVDPVFDLGTEQVHLPDPQQDARLQQDLKVDRERYHGLHGTAVLSRYPIRNAQIVRLPDCYDWYGQEVKQIAKLERGKRWAAHRLFKERVEREVRQGGRMALIVDLAIPEVPTGEATIVATHLENKCAPECRRKQMTALLNTMKEDSNPVVLAGDLNTTGTSNTPTAVRDEIMSRVTDYKFWTKQAISHFNPLGIYQYALFPVHYLHGYHDPTAFNVPVVWEHRERPLFKTVEKFRFADGRSFDFRGDPSRSLGNKGKTLADSNERAGKGFVTTYAFSRDYWGLVGRYKLDWFFVKPFVTDSRRGGQSDVFAPHFAETMRDLNESVYDRISDHPPMTVDLPLREPPTIANVTGAIKSPSGDR
jgi:endonuclease/exonuclease/phosphatase family metal-dependent hydrolase